MNKMNKGKILLAASLFLFAHSAQAKVDICVFDLLGKAGESYKLMEDWLLASKNWNADVGLKIVADEAQAEREFRAGNCDGVYMTSIRARAFNKFAGSIDALGGVPSNAIAQKAISYALDQRNSKRLVSRLEGQVYEVAGIGQLGAAYIFVKDRNINTVEKIAKKKFAVLGHDAAQRIMVQRINAKPVASEISNFVSKFNNGQADIVAAPAYAYRPLEIYKGMGPNGAMINFPVVNVTADLIIRPDKFPQDFAAKSRQWFLKQLPRSMAMVQRLEAGIPAKLRIQLSSEDRTAYQRLLREGRIDLTRQGIYDETMMRVLKRARCTVERTNFECSLSGE
jgi:hypothetical protein